MKLAKYITIPVYTKGEFKLPSNTNITKICLKAFKVLSMAMPIT